MKRKLRVLLLAYACEPNKGSEPGVGWNWANELALRHEVWVVTRSNNRKAIEEAFTGKSAENLHFVYHDLPNWSCFWKKGRLSVYPYYLLWHMSLGTKLRELNNEVGFDILHHLTFSTDWLPVFSASKINIPTVVGPLAGYEADDAIRKFVSFPYPLIHHLKMVTRQILVRLRAKELRSFSLVISNNQNYTRYYTEHIGVKRCVNISTQGYSASLHASNMLASKLPCERQRQLNITMGGRMKYWKGYDVAISVFAELKKQGMEFQATLIGSGSHWYEKRILKLIKKLGVSSMVSIIKELPRDLFLKKLKDSDLFLYPTFYGTGDAVMLEAVILNIPVVCFPSAGAKEVFGEDYPYMSRDFSIKSIAEIVINTVNSEQIFGETQKAILKQQELSRKIDLLTEAYWTLIQERVSRKEREEAETYAI